MFNMGDILMILTDRKIYTAEKLHIKISQCTKNWFLIHIDMNATLTFTTGKLKVDIKVCKFVSRH